ncbi:WecB/TagA/CpsF family glycosyltransferase [Parasphingorhabdus sp.]|uniref:WecB/TagA/CpsF family glycosyltransferase n=1 Tax=Parasphingorhabdus sp. TaxID=2709688 RepID=UPI00326662A4
MVERAVAIGDRTDHKPVRFLGVDIVSIDLAEALTEIVQMARQDRFSYVVTPNVDHLVNLYPKQPESKHQLFRDAYDAADLTVCDSRILKSLASLSGISLTVVPGSDLTASLFDQRLATGDRVAIIGGDDKLLDHLKRLHPQPTYCQHIPPMGVLNKPDDMQEIVHFVENAGADYILFAIGSPQSEIIAHQCAQSQKCRGVGLCIGASLEFITSAKKRAPKWMQAAGLEWAFRLISEPRRLWRRYLVEDIRIFPIWFRHKDRTETR